MTATKKIAAAIFLHCAGLCLSLAAEAKLPAALPPTPVVTNQAPLFPTAFHALPLGSVRPLGWLKKQCELQRDGLTGNAEILYPNDLGTNSAWLGGTGEDWERGPYYVKGLVALAYTLDDASLKLKAKKWIDWLLEHQGSDGYLGPKKNADWWPRMVATYALKDYYEATGDARVLPVLGNYFQYMLAHLPERPLNDWGKARAGDEIEVILWLYNQQPDPRLLKLARLLEQQAYDWPAIFADNKFVLYGKDFQPKHNVNVEQALKFPEEIFQLTGDPAMHKTLAGGLNHLMRENALPCDINTGTEFLSGNSSIQGVELCAVVEAMLSLETAVRISGDAAYADRLEMITFNALPAGLSTDIHGLQYFILPNNVIAKFGFHGFNQDYENGTLPGPDSGYACCRYNFHMGWPKFVQNSWAATPDGGLAALAFGPSVVSAKIAGQPVQITEETDYPFNQKIHFRLAMDAPVPFNFTVRIPAWSSNAMVSVNGRAQRKVTSGTFLKLAREWKNGDEVVVDLPMPIQTIRGPENSLAIHRGPLVYSLEIAENRSVRTRDPRGQGFDECEYRAASPWNYGLKIDPSNPAGAFQVLNRSMPENPFDGSVTPVLLTTQGRQLKEWTIGWRGTHAFEPPTSPASSAAALESIRLVPFGSQRLRVSWFPYLGPPPPRSGVFTEKFDESWPARWTTFGGNWSARENILSTMPASANGAKALAMSTMFTNFIYDADVSVGPAGNAGLLFRAGRPDIGADAYCGYYVGVSVENHRLEFGYASNSWHPLITVPIVAAPQENHHFRVQASGAQLQVFFDDMKKPAIDLQNREFSAGMIGVRDYCPDGDRSISSFSNIAVKEINNSGSLEGKRSSPAAGDAL